jgi:hypothetical protein
LQKREKIRAWTRISQRRDSGFRIGQELVTLTLNFRKPAKPASHDYIPALEVEPRLCHIYHLSILGNHRN